MIYQILALLLVVFCIIFPFCAILYVIYTLCCTTIDDMQKSNDLLDTLRNKNKKQTFTVSYKRTYFFNNHEETEWRKVDIIANTIEEAYRDFETIFENRNTISDIYEINYVYSYYPNSKHIYKKYDGTLKVIEIFNY